MWPRDAAWPRTRIRAMLRRRARRQCEHDQHDHFRTHACPEPRDPDEDGDFVTTEKIAGVISPAPTVPTAEEPPVVYELYGGWAPCTPWTRGRPRCRAAPRARTAPGSGGQRLSVIVVSTRSEA